MLSASFLDYLKECFDAILKGDIASRVNHAINAETVSFFGLQVNPSVYIALLVSGILIIAFALIRIFYIPKFKKIPKGLQLLLENIITYFDKSTANVVHKHSSFVGPYVFTSAIFIAVSTLVELLGLRPVFSSVNACFAFGISTFIIINICGFREKGFFGRLKRYKNPLNIISDLSVPLSMSLRLFGSILSGFIIMELLYSVIFLSFVIPSAVAVITTIFHAFLQAYLFFMLSNIFVGEAIE